MTEKKPMTWEETKDIEKTELLAMCSEINKKLVDFAEKSKMTFTEVIEFVKLNVKGWSNK